MQRTTVSGRRCLRAVSDYVDFDAVLDQSLCGDYDLIEASRRVESPLEYLVAAAAEASLLNSQYRVAVIGFLE